MSAVRDGTSSFGENDAALAAAIAEAHLPALLAACVQLTGDMSLLHNVKSPAYDFFGDGRDGGFTPAEQDELRARILAALKSWRDDGCPTPAPPDAASLNALMDFVAGASIPDRYIPYLEEEMEFSGDDTRAPLWGANVPDSTKRNFKVLIIGAGLSGILAAIRLQQAGVPFVMVERNADVAGTWHVNTYPGCRVDNPNHMYCYSFAPNHDWPQHYSSQPVLDAYFRDVAARYGIREQIRFETTVEDCAYDEAHALWRCQLHSSDGAVESLTVNAVITAVGQLREPKLPDIKGVGSFKGPAFHSASWDHDVDLAGKRVAVIGTGASAFQLVPEIANVAKEVKVFQRTPPWLVPTANYHGDVPEGQKHLLKTVPTYAQWYRFWLFWMLTDGMLPFLKVDPAWSGRTDAVSTENDALRTMLTQYIQSQLADWPDLLEAAVPSYPPGGKRPLRDDGLWLSTLKRDNVELVTDPVAEITPGGLRLASGRAIDADVLIYATGFQASHFLEPMRIAGRDGQDLHEMWAGDPRAYLGIAVPGFPNFFMLYGPNTNIVVNGSVIFFSECAMRYVMGCLELLLTQGHAALEVKQDVHDAFNEKVDAGNAAMAWGVPQVSNWYKNDEGRVTQNWPFLLVDYWEATRAPDPADFRFTRAGHSAAE